MLAGIPSVVYGLVGMMVLVPGIRKLFNVPDGASLLASIIVLAIMILPSIIKMSVTALEAVPKEYEDASLALGATPEETWFRVSVPAAKSGIAAAVVLGVGRAIGEAMAVMMVAGNAANMPDSLFQSVRFLTTAVASEMSYSSGLQRQALFSIALVLFLFIMLINAVLNFFLKGENIAYGPRTHGITNKAQLDDIVEKALRGAAIWDEVKDRLKKNALGMSGGQQQRLCIARALAVEPTVLLMDEPTSALDPISTSRIEDLAMELKEKYTIVIVTHNMQQAVRISDQTAFFLLGDLVEFGNTEEMFSQPKDKRTEDYITGRFG